MTPEGWRPSPLKGWGCAVEQGDAGAEPEGPRAAPLASPGIFGAVAGWPAAWKCGPQLSPAPHACGSKHARAALLRGLVSKGGVSPQGWGRLGSPPCSTASYFSPSPQPRAETEDVAINRLHLPTPSPGPRSRAKPRPAAGRTTVSSPSLHQTAWENRSTPRAPRTRSCTARASRWTRGIAEPGDGGDSLGMCPAPWSLGPGGQPALPCPKTWPHPRFTGGSPLLTALIIQQQGPAGYRNLSEELAYVLILFLDIRPRFLPTALRRSPATSCPCPLLLHPSSSPVSPQTPFSSPS